MVTNISPCNTFQVQLKFNYKLFLVLFDALNQMVPSACLYLYPFSHSNQKRAKYRNLNIHVHRSPLFPSNVPSRARLVLLDALNLLVLSVPPYLPRFSHYRQKRVKFRKTDISAHRFFSKSLDVPFRAYPYPTRCSESKGAIRFSISLLAATL